MHVLLYVNAPREPFMPHQVSRHGLPHAAAAAAPSIEGGEGSTCRPQGARWPNLSVLKTLDTTLPHTRYDTTVLAVDRVYHP